MPKKADARISETGSHTGTGTGTDADVLTEIESHVFELVDKYISSLDNPDDIYSNNGLFLDMLKYIYRYYIKVLLDNGDYKDILRYDYSILNQLFYIYTSLVYRYKKNNQPYINEFCIFCNIDRTMLYRIRQGYIKRATKTDIFNVQKWFEECEQGLLNTDTVGSIFRLKSMYGYNDNLSAVPIEMQNNALSVKQLPDLSKTEEKTPAGIPQKA